MASLHPASRAGTPATLEPRFVFSPPRSENPFLSVAAPAPPAPALSRLSADGPLAESLEITVMWGTTVLSVTQLTPVRAYAVGEVGGPGGAGTSASGPVDFALAAERLGSDRRELVSLRHGRPFAVFGANDTPRVLEKGRPVDASGATVDFAEVAPGARGLELCQDRTVIVESGGMVFRICGMERPTRLPRAVLGATDRGALATMGGAALLQGVVVASLAYFTPDLAWAADDEMNRERVELMQQYLHAQAERQREQPPAKASDEGGEKGAPAAGSPGPEGKSGRPNAPQQQRRAAIAGEHPERVIARSELLKEATSIGMIGLLSSMNATEAPSSPWGADLALGPDAQSAHGDMWGDEIGDTAGSGLGLSGLGQGAGGPGLGIGMGRIGTCMGLNCYGNGAGDFGRDVGRTKPGHESKAPRIRPDGVSIVSGRLPAEVIQRTVRQNFGRFRQCYELGLRTNPNLQGRVTARFVIGRDGAVSNVSVGGSDLPDAQVASCVASSFYGLSFPSPEGGIVTVSYPILLTPG